MALILASASSIRQEMLNNAGVSHRAIPSAIDEAEIKARMGAHADVALALAEAKALGVASLYPDDLVIGSDSVVRVDGRPFDKPENRDQAVDHLRFFSGKQLELTSAVALWSCGRIEWSHSDQALLQVRHLSEPFIESYLDSEWPAVGACVGVFRMEAMGAQLFERIEGSYFTILGMPLIPLLGALRDRGVLQS